MRLAYPLLDINLVFPGLREIIIVIIIIIIIIIITLLLLLLLLLILLLLLLLIRVNETHLFLLMWAVAI